MRQRRRRKPRICRRFVCGNAASGPDCCLHRRIIAYSIYVSIGTLPLCNSQLTYEPHFRMAYASARLDISAIHGIGRPMHTAASRAILSVDAIDRSAKERLSRSLALTARRPIRRSLSVLCARRDCRALQRIVQKCATDKVASMQSHQLIAN